jgi:Protein of unknown function (DUF3738)
VARSTALALALALGLANMPVQVQAQASTEAVPSAISHTTPEWQTRAGGRMAFEVASIHLAKPGTFSPPSFALDPGDSAIPPGGHFFADFPLLAYLTFAYKIWPIPEQRRALLAQMPKWAREESFVIEAKAEGNPSKDQMRLMVQSLLADRFKLTVHFERQQSPVFAVALANQGDWDRGFDRMAKGRLAMLKCLRWYRARCRRLRQYSPLAVERTRGGQCRIM